MAVVLRSVRIYIYIYTHTHTHQGDVGHHILDGLLFSKGYGLFDHQGQLQAGLLESNLTIRKRDLPTDC